MCDPPRRYIVGLSVGGCFSTSADGHSSAGFVFQPQAWTFKETEQWWALWHGNFLPRSLKRHIVFFFSQLTHPRCFASTNDLAQWQPCRFQWTVDAVFFFLFCFGGFSGRKREEESVEKLHGGKHKFQCCYCSIVSPTDCIKRLAVASRSESEADAKSHKAVFFVYTSRCMVAKRGQIVQKVFLMTYFSLDL